ncbi:predicted protein [Nematostella vectensis]|uniref:Retinol dehydrogenase 8-like n=1 Tax=Nematostella vectensis TaxID=45351 RepID=A7RSA6_NEMVE|nr:retinol dehydrogenase 8 [Nematostella vectensis]EDO45710.1 predicted protein [Nematostella vectensis]|eukprot:XP_001637773.1 predicted protein [Nematostella vectensis]
MAAPTVVLITGCSTGIGLAAALLLAKDDGRRFKVYATMRNLEKRGILEEAARRQLGDTLIVKQLDVTSDESVTEVLQSIYSAERRIDVLVNNAGVGLIGVLETHTMSLVREMFNVNFFGVVRLTKAVIPKMKENHSGHIINITSIGGIRGVPFNAIYCSSKFAVEGMAESLAPLLRKFNVKITNVEPGPVKTAFVANSTEMAPVYDDEGVDEETKQLLENAKTKMMSAFATVAQSPEEIAQCILDIILMEKCPLRYQTNKNYANVVSSKLVDPSGDAEVDAMFTRFFS